MQLEHEAANHDEADSDDDGKDADEKIVISSLVLQLVNRVVKVAFLVDG